MRIFFFGFCLIPLAISLPKSVDASENEEGIALLFIRDFSFQSGVNALDNEHTIIDCIRRTLRDRRPATPVLDVKALQATVLPQLPVSAVPRHPKYMNILLKDDAFRQRMRSHGIRFVAYVGGASKTQQESSGFCVGGYAAAACFLFAQWHENARLGASIVDLADLASNDQLQSESQDTAWFALIGVLPVGMPSNAEDHLCRDVGVQISEYLDARLR
jgi:hypothetical protein